jgi:RHS repeat-associated protein
VADLGPLPTGTARDVRVKFHLLDAAGTSSAAPLVTEADDGSGTVIVLGPSGPFVGPRWSSWGSASAFQKIDVKSGNNANPCRSSSAPYGQCNASGTCAGCSGATITTWYGVSLEALQYRIRDVAATNAVWPPFLFAGQYLDDETEMAENWNRYYEPMTGRYLEPEPKVVDGSNPTLPMYSYAGNNPIQYGDADGREIRTAGSFEGYFADHYTTECPPSSDPTVGGQTCKRFYTYISPCRPTNDQCKTWKFDVDIDFWVYINFITTNGHAPYNLDTSGARTIWEHEHDHLNRIFHDLSYDVINQTFQTEGFANRPACQSARRRLIEGGKTGKGALGDYEDAAGGKF